MIEEYNPGYPSTGSIKYGFDPSLERIVKLYLALEGFRNITPTEQDINT